jgi:hypothetical protein
MEHFGTLVYAEENISEGMINTVRKDREVTYRQVGRLVYTKKKRKLYTWLHISSKIQKI